MPRSGPRRSCRTADRGRGTVLATVDHQVPLQACDRCRYGARVWIEQTGRCLAQFCIIEGRLYIILISGSNSIGTNTRIRTGKVHGQSGGGGDGFGVDRTRLGRVATLVGRCWLGPIRVRRTINGTGRGIALRIEVLTIRVLIGNEGRTTRSAMSYKSMNIEQTSTIISYSPQSLLVHSVLVVEAGTGRIGVHIGTCCRSRTGLM